VLEQIPPSLKCSPAQIPGVKTSEVRDADYEVMLPSGLIDARDKMPDGAFWRERTSFGEATHYWDVDQRTAELLNRLIDGDCRRE